MLQHHLPPPPLSDYVNQLWYFDGILGSHARERVLPDGSMNVLIDLREGGGPSIVAGARSEYFVIESSSAMHVMGIWFKPGGAFPFFRMPASELRDRHVPLDDVWGALGAEMRERMLAAPGAAAKFAVVEEMLLERMARRIEPHAAVRYALGEFRHVSRRRSVSSVTGAIGMSARRFAQLFSEQVGLTPKLFCRVRRFQRVLHLINENNEARDIDWAGVALSCGYFDQPHFIHDFRAFSGINPTEYVVRGSRYVNHVPMD
jgi:AraC-like DNA-binding protein